MLRPSQCLRPGLVIACLCAAVILLGYRLTSRPQRTAVTYQGRSLEYWFYGGRTNFFMERTRKQTQQAVSALGTNAFPFLVANLNRPVGSANLYFRFYQASPGWIQTRLRYPILDDDIKAITLGHIRDMRPVPEPVIQSLAECFPTLKNPRLRFIAFGISRHSHPDFLKLCRKLLDDAHPGIRLEAAIALAENGLVSDPGEPRLFPILLAALKSKTERDACLEIASYILPTTAAGKSQTTPITARLSRESGNPRAISAYPN